MRSTMEENLGDSNFNPTEVFGLIRATMVPFVDILVPGQLRYLTRCEGDHGIRCICDNLKLSLFRWVAGPSCSLTNRGTSEEFYCFASADRSPHVSLLPSSAFVRLYPLTRDS